MPGFLVPTVDVDEIDKRIADLRAAESWIEVNLNMLRATIQGLEVQRHTIAALQSLSAMPAAAAQAARTSSAPEPRREPTPEPRSPSPEPQGEVRPPAPPAPAALANDAAPSSAPLAGMAASNWLGYLQDQFTKVAQAAMAGSTAVTDRSASAPVGGEESDDRGASAADDDDAPQAGREAPQGSGRARLTIRARTPRPRLRAVRRHDARRVARRPGDDGRRLSFVRRSDDDGPSPTARRALER